MSDYRSAAERFVTEFLDYVYKYDIKDALNKQTQKMERSPGVADLIRMAESVFPTRIKQGGTAPVLTAEEIDVFVKNAPNVVDTREMFSRKIQANGGTRKLLRDLYDGTPGSEDAVREFLEAEDGNKEFLNVPTKV